jgi:hypothetical protein
MVARAVISAGIIIENQRQICHNYLIFAAIGGFLKIE